MLSDLEKDESKGKGLGRKSLSLVKNDEKLLNVAVER